MIDRNAGTMEATGGSGVTARAAPVEQTRMPAGDKGRARIQLPFRT